MLYLVSTAQKLGLVAAPTRHLTEADWSVVKDSSNRRHDSAQPCVICKEHFGTEQQVSTTPPGG